ncbi:hypothetical protein CPB84DRAFT_1850966 [Gymnopilus junonius]|uniref:Uncharacterized protein n=1 Tax=Gymnopilus junonius TaxID=109634 RepID=A0A9P5TJQ1_GYMJU|nr:hypothetical protein CPB84DRAFT_1850966 [Gymnopilus junonius]
MSEESEKTFTQAIGMFIVGTLPSQIYLHFLLRLPSLYFSRVARIFEEADLTLPEIKKMALETASQGKANFFDFQVLELQNVPPEYERLKSTWEAFIDSVMREWKTFNLISVLLLSAILTILQIQSAASDPITRYTALFSLICALISLLFGCMYIIRFGSMRKTYKAAEWALEAKKTKTIWWNVWVLLAMPAIWLTWSIVLYIACIMSFIWRTSPLDDGPTFNVTNRTIFAVRIAISTVLGLGVIYGWLILSTFRRYGTAMDKTWKKRIDGWIEEKAQIQSSTPYPYSTPYYDPTSYAPQSYPNPYPGNVQTPWPPPPQGLSPWAAPTQAPPPWGPPPQAPVHPPDSPAMFRPATDIPPPEPYDSEEPSEEDGPTSNATQSNTFYNKFSSGPQPGDSSSGSGVPDRPGSISETPPVPAPPTQVPQPPRNITTTLAPTRTPLAVPPPPTLPPIPGTPANPYTQPSSLRNSAEIRHLSPALGLNLHGQPEEEEEDSHDYRVRFRSPLLSAQTSTYTDSEADETSRFGPMSPGLASSSVANHGPPESGPSGVSRDTESPNPHKNVDS